MKLFLAYLKQRRKWFFILILFCVIFLATFILYHLPTKAVLYPAFICTMILIVFEVFDYAGVKKKHKILSEIKDMHAAVIDSLPDTINIDDNDYQEIIRVLSEDISSLQTQADTKYRDMIEYYTVWAHQIKTPISSMRLNLQSEDSPLSFKCSSDLMRIEQYVEMVLTFLRLNSDSSDYVFKKHDLDTIIRGCIKRFSGEFISRKLRLSYEPICKTVVTDDKWLSFVLEQLISNALKYTREGGSIRIYVKDPDILCIEDTGIGIEPSDLPRIFENGYTGRNGRSDKRATGIGLYLCKRVCQNLGIVLKASSVVSVGTTVSLDLSQYKLKKE